MDLSRGSSKILDEKVFLVKLSEDMNKTGGDNSKSETKRPMSEKTRLIRIKPEKKFDIDSQDKIVSVETSTAIENNNDSNLQDLNTQEKSANKVLLADYKIGENNAIDIPYGQEAGIKGSRDLPISGNDGVSKNKKGLSAGIIAIIRDSIEKAKTYPVLARKMGLDGTVYIGFRISPQGEPQDIRIIKSSGVRILDAATMNIVKKAAPFPRVDASIEVPVVFKLE